MADTLPTAETRNEQYLSNMATGVGNIPDTPITRNEQYLDAIVDRMSAVTAMGKYLSTWNCTTGLPGTEPQTTPYTYSTGDYFVVNTVAASGGTNYKPNGTTYTGAASTTVDTSTIALFDMYRFDGTTWELLKFSAVLGGFVKSTSISHETWTFTLEDESTVTKEVVLWN